MFPGFIKLIRMPPHKTFPFLNLFGKITHSEEMKYTPFSIPGANSDKLFAKILNSNTRYRPVLTELKMKAGAFFCHNKG